jgi:FAD/FMN-containing dehydrogenase
MAKDGWLEQLERLLPGKVARDASAATAHVWNALLHGEPSVLHPHRPAAVVCCSSSEDVVKAATLGVQHKLCLSAKGGSAGAAPHRAPCALRAGPGGSASSALRSASPAAGTGHQYGGAFLPEGGILLDMSGMTRATIDPKAQTATIEPVGAPPPSPGAPTAGLLGTPCRLAACRPPPRGCLAHRRSWLPACPHTCLQGCTTQQVRQLTSPHGLHFTGGHISTVGCTGFTLGGGNGFGQRLWGAACDNLISAKVCSPPGAPGALPHGAPPQRTPAARSLALAGPPCRRSPRQPPPAPACRRW